MGFADWFGRRGDADSVNRLFEAYQSLVVPGRLSLERFWEVWGSGEPPSVLASLVKLDLQRRFERGERPRVLDYLRAFPILATLDDRVVSLVYEEFCLLQENGEDPDSRRFCDDYDPWRDSLASQLTYHRELSRAVGAERPSVKFPNPGDRFDKYRLTSILGEGGVARVFLATEDDLGGRKLAIKVSDSFGQEPSILAKLDHRSIVPILTVAESETGLRGICMPYRPGVTLELLIRRMGEGSRPRSARAIVDLLRPDDLSDLIASEAQRAGWDDFPIDRTFAEAVAWMGLALAQALAYLHKEGVFHRDIKPANILLAYREGPQLLDFNLARVPSGPSEAAAAQKGGTLPYMAPEQLRAFLDPAAWEDVNEAADLYSLGLVLRELLTGKPPDLPTSRGSLAREIQSLLDLRMISPVSICEVNTAVPPALDSIVAKCMAFQPSDRYACAEDLVNDLRLFLVRKPLLIAPNTSKIERVFNWIYRNRHYEVATILSTIVLLVLLALLPKGDNGKSEFARAEALLYSGRPEDLPLARTAFERLHRERPDTARSSLGLALTLRKLGGRDTRPITELFKEAVHKKDSESVIKEHLARDPNSNALLLNLGIALMEGNRLDLAADCFRRSLRVDPRGLMALTGLAELERRAGRDEEALGHLGRAIDLVEGKLVKGKLVYELRKATLEILLRLIDRQIDAAHPVRGRAEVDDRVRQFEGQLHALVQDWGKLLSPGNRDELDYSVNFYEGCLLSIRGVLQFDVQNPARSKQLFELAGKKLDEAGTRISSLGAPEDRLQLLDLQVSKLSERRQRLVANP